MRASAGSVGDIVVPLNNAGIFGSPRLQRQVADRLATGQPADALAFLGEHGCLHGFDDARDARSALIAAWAGPPSPTPRVR